MQQASNRNDRLTATIEWPRPLSAQALKAIKVLLLGGLVITAVIQIVPFQLLGGLANNFFTILLVLSWIGPARRYLRRRTEEKGTAPEES
ncbi:hypothetical protein BJ994_002977 [Arthrobacter pigmenti]|uniref:Uncharacterized protein n=1 Tax=Arthrobacter pigmenti TaxID=271432 RepID=A0A846S0E7_9MICC|nr:hypothetical protein [Arthrobacter pigmenti]NJC23901.1 hypothetical protein [Arthrobacter pigmenti]